MLEPDRNQIETFVGALFRHAGKDGFVSLRAFYHDNKVFNISPVTLAYGLKAVQESARVCALRAAQASDPVVFCPPVATFTNKDRAAAKKAVVAVERTADLLDFLFQTKAGMIEQP